MKKSTFFIRFQVKILFFLHNQCMFSSLNQILGNNAFSNNRCKNALFSPDFRYRYFPNSLFRNIFIRFPVKVLFPMEIVQKYTFSSDFWQTYSSQQCLYRNVSFTSILSKYAIQKESFHQIWGKCYFSTEFEQKCFLSVFGPKYFFQQCEEMSFFHKISEIDTFSMSFQSVSLFRFWEKYTFQESL